MKRVLALAMAFVLMMGTVLPTAVYANATGLAVAGDSSTGGYTEEAAGSGSAEEEQEPVLYNETDRLDLEPAEVAEAEDIIVAAGYGFDVEQSFDGLSYDEKAVKVSYYADKGSFDAAGDKASDLEWQGEVM